jgi:3-isopropylmalate/(R)-2-methylmalate dehydratase large subunit
MTLPRSVGAPRRALRPDEPDLLYIDLHLVHEVTSPQAFDGCGSAAAGAPPDLTIATEDHNVPTEHIDQPIADPISARQVEVLRENTASSASRCSRWATQGRGIVHVIGPEQGAPCRA